MKAALFFVTILSSSLCGIAYAQPDSRIANIRLEVVNGEKKAVENPRLNCVAPGIVVINTTSRGEGAPGVAQVRAEVGMYHCTVKADGYRDLMSEVMLRHDIDTTVTLYPLKSIRADTLVNGEYVSVDGLQAVCDGVSYTQRIGPSLLLRTLSVGDHNCEFSAAGFQNLRKTIKVYPDGDFNESLIMTPEGMVAEVRPVVRPAGSASKRRGVR